MILKKYFSESDLALIQKAVADAETKTSGEIVPFFAESSGFYPVAYWKSGLFFSLLCSFTAFWFDVLNPAKIPLNMTALFILLAGFSGALLGFGLVGINANIKRLFIGYGNMQEVVNFSAHKAFLQEEVFKTKYRTGVLIYLSLFERQVVVLGDIGISVKVSQSEWDQIVKTITSGMKTGKPAEHIIQAIKSCSDLLLRSGLIDKEGINELPNELRTEIK